MLEKLEEIRRKYDEVRARLADPEFVQDHRAVRDAQKTLSEFEPIIAKMEEHAAASRRSSTARGSWPSRSRPATSSTRWPSAERAALTERLAARRGGAARSSCCPKDPNDSRNVFLEIRAGTGGDEAALFAARALPDVPALRRAPRAGRSRSWTGTTPASAGSRRSRRSIEGEGAYSRLKYEGGVHRVQRVPATEASGPHPHVGRHGRRPAGGRGRGRQGRGEGHPRRPLLRLRARAGRASTRPTRPCG